MSISVACSSPEARAISPTSSQCSSHDSTDSEVPAGESYDGQQPQDLSSREIALTNIIGEQAKEIARLQLIIARYELRGPLAQQRKERDSIHNLTSVLSRLAEGIEALVSKELGDDSTGLENLVGLTMEIRGTIDGWTSAEARALLS